MDKEVIREIVRAVPDRAHVFVTLKGGAQIQGSHIHNGSADFMRVRVGDPEVSVSLTHHLLPFEVIEFVTYQSKN